MPQEVEVWYLIPSLRKAFAEIFAKEYKMNQRQIAKILGITESAVSQYVNSKRASNIKFNASEFLKIKLSAKRIVLGKSKIMKEIFFLCNLFKKSKTICRLHKAKDSSIRKNCKVCFD